MRTLLAVLMVLALAFSVSADLLSAWNVLGVNASTTPIFTNTFSAANIASNSCVLSLGAGVNASGTGDTFGGTDWDEVDLANAISVNDYVSWFVQADPGYQISITNISYNFNRTSTGGSNYVVRSSFDGFTVDLYGLTNFSATAGGGDASFAVSLSGSNSVEFRLYAWSASAGGGVDRLRNLSGDDLTVEGAVIPEPGTILLLSLGLATLLIQGLRRR